MVLGPRLVLAAIALVLTSVARAQGVPRLDSLVPPLMKRYAVPGVAIAIVRGDSIVALEGFGHARVRDSARVDPERSIFRIASVAKLFVATAVMQQVERGALDLDADVNRYLAWRVPDTWPEPITLDRLLTHTAGFDERLIGYAARSRADVGALGPHLASNLPARGWAPGAAIGYSNYGFALAAHLVERSSGLSFRDYARERLFAPLGMSRTSYVDVPDSLRGLMADGHFCDQRSCDTAPEVFSHPYAVGLAYSTAHDMARFMIAQLNSGTTPHTRVLDSASVARMQMQHFSGDAAVPGISYAFFNQRAHGYRVLAHGGSVPGISSLLLLVPDERLGVFLIANGGRSAFGAALRDSLFATLLPARAMASVRSVSLSDEYLRSIAGPYQIARYAHRTVETFPFVFATTVLLRVEDHRLVLPYPNGAAQFEALDSLHFREVGGERLIAFLRDDAGRITKLAAPIPFFGADIPSTLERRRWYESAHFLNEYISWLLLGPLTILIVAWPAALLVARWRRGVVRSASSSRLPWLAYGLAVLFNLLWLAFGFGFVARSVRMFERSTGLVYGVPPSLRAMSILPWIMAAVAVALLWSTGAAFARRWWDWPRRALFVLATLGALLTVCFLVRWNYLPATF